MTYKVLYRAYRPNTFEEIVGLDYIIKTLKNSLAQQKLAHAYLFCGPRGTGKTSVARLLAKAVNCESDTTICNKCPSCLEANAGSHPDIIEVDAASNNGVDEIRSLIEKVKFSPLQGKYKIYIIDEVHMLTTGAFNALLKTLEEPPSHVIFILATTEIQKVIPTIVSRCQRYDFTKISNDNIVKALVPILKKENVKYKTDSLDLIAKLADGGLRDALSILDQALAYDDQNLDVKTLASLYGVSTLDEQKEFLSLLLENKTPELLTLIERFEQKNIDFKRLSNDLITLIKDELIFLYTSKDNEFKTTSNHLTIILEELLDFSSLPKNTNLSFYFELLILKLIAKLDSNSPQKEMASVPTVSPKPPINSVLETKKTDLEIEKTFETKKTTPPAEDLFLPYLKLLVGANKDYRSQVLQYWTSIEDYQLDLNYGKYAKLLGNSKLVAAGVNYLLLHNPSRSLVEEINNLTSQEFFNFTYQVFKKPYKIFLIETKQVESLLEHYKQRQQNHTLPKAAVINFAFEEEPKTTEDKMKKIFGDSLTILEEEK